MQEVDYLILIEELCKEIRCGKKSRAGSINPLKNLVISYEKTLYGEEIHE